MRLHDLMHEYFELGQRALAKRTQSNYRCRLKRFLEFLGPEAVVADLERRAIQRYINRVGDQSAHAVRMHHATIRHFCEWLKEEQWFAESPCKGISLPKVTKGRRTPVPDDALEQLFAACDRLPRSEYKKRLAKAVLSLLAYGGLRRSEALHLTLEDVDLETGRVFVACGKGAKSRNVYLCKEGIDAIRALLKLRPACDHNRLLAYNKQYGLMFHGLRSIMETLHTIAGIDEHYTPHQLRHAYATRLARNGAPLPAISRALGHTRLETTALYLHAGEEDVKAISHLASLKPASQVELPKEMEMRQKPSVTPRARRRVALRRAA